MEEKQLSKVGYFSFNAAISESYEFSTCLLFSYVTLRNMVFCIVYLLCHTPGFSVKASGSDVKKKERGRKS